jgi:hypothetical protein
MLVGCGVWEMKVTENGEGKKTNNEFLGLTGQQLTGIGILIIVAFGVLGLAVTSKILCAMSGAGW